jgi:hypothetical protein
MLMVEWSVDDELERTWKEAVVAWSRYTGKFHIVVYTVRPDNN